MSSDNKIVIFDWGGVVEQHCSCNDKISCNDAWGMALETMGCTVDSIEKVTKFVCRSEQGCSRMTEITDRSGMDNWISNMLMQLGLKGNQKDVEDFKEAYKYYMGYVNHYSEIVRFAHRVGQRYGLKTGVLSNLSILDIDRIDKQMDLSMFDEVWLSFQIGARKPSKEIYESVESKGYAPKDIMFFDDTDENIKAAQSRGWNTMLVTEGNELDTIEQMICAIEGFVR